MSSLWSTRQGFSSVIPYHGLVSRSIAARHITDATRLSPLGLAKDARIGIRRLSGAVWPSRLREDAKRVEARLVPCLQGGILSHRRIYLCIYVRGGLTFLVPGIFDLPISFFFFFFLGFFCWFPG